MKNLFLIVCFIFATGISSYAQKIAIVDVNQILSELSDYDNAQKEIDKISAEWRQEIALELDEVKSLYNKYQAEQVLLSDDIKLEREEQIMQKEGAVRELQKRRFGPEGDLFRKRQELVAPIQDKVFAAIEEFAEDRGYDMIFDKGGAAGLLYATDAFDKTDDVKRKLGIR